MQEERFLDLAPNTMRRVEGEFRVLQDEANSLAADMAPAGCIEGREVSAGKRDAAAGPSHPARQKAKDGARGHRLTGTGLADKRHALAVDDEGNAGEDRAASLGAGDLDREVVYDEQRLSHGGGQGRREGRRRRG